MKYAATFIGWSNTGKTGLITDLIGGFSSRGYRVSALKSSHVPADFDVPGKDTDRFFQSGAERVGYFSSEGGFLRFREKPSLENLEEFFEGCDILLVEGLRLPGHPCLEVVNNRNLREGYKCGSDEVAAYVAVATDPGSFNNRPAGEQPVFPVSDTGHIMDFLEELWTKR